MGGDIEPAVEQAAEEKCALQIHRLAVDPLPEQFHAEEVLKYDMNRFAFLEALRDVLQEPAGADLGQLHNTPLGVHTLEGFQKRLLLKKAEALGPRGNPWNRRFHNCTAREPAHFARFLQVYHDFLGTFILDNLKTSRVAFQTAPTFRCHLPQCGAPGRPHRDEDYFHPCCEVNFWIPVTPVFGSNSLYSETRRGAGDYHAFEAQGDQGELIRFWGNQVWHYTMPNETDATRVSFDFRVIREQEWCSAAFQGFQLGRYFSVMTPNGILRNDSEEMHELQKKYDCFHPNRPAKQMQE